MTLSCLDLRMVKHPLRKWVAVTMFPNQIFPNGTHGISLAGREFRFSSAQAFCPLGQINSTTQSLFSSSVLELHRDAAREQGPVHPLAFTPEGRDFVLLVARIPACRTPGKQWVPSQCPVNE